MFGRPEHYRARGMHGGFDICQHHSSSAIRDQRAVGAFQRSGDIRVLVAFVAAEFVAEILAHLGKRVADAVLVVFRRQCGERIRLVAMSLKIGIGNLPEHTGKAGGNIAIFRQIGGLEQFSPICGPGVVVICSTPTTRTFLAAPALMVFKP